MTTRVSFEGKSGTQGSGELAEPEGTGRVPAVILLQEHWGVNDHIRDLTDRLAAEGFVVLAPDLYHGKVARDAAEAMELMKALDTLAAVDEIARAVAFVRAHPRSTGKVGVVGFCMGGALALATACHLAGIGAAVSFYGIPPAEKVDYREVTAPVLMHVGTRDEWVTVGKAEAIKQQIEAREKDVPRLTQQEREDGYPSVAIEVYDANHAFVNDTRPEVHDPASTKLAWDRTVAFLRRHLRS